LIMLEPREPRQRPNGAPTAPSSAGRKRMSSNAAVRSREGGERIPEPPEQHLSELLRALQAVAEGDFSVKLPTDWVDLQGKIADSFNVMVSNNRRMAE